jgi:hypothetical protein
MVLEISSKRALGRLISFLEGKNKFKEIWLWGRETNDSESDHLHVLHSLCRQLRFPYCCKAKNHVFLIVTTKFQHPWHKHKRYVTLNCDNNDLVDSHVCYYYIPSKSNTNASKLSSIVVRLDVCHLFWLRFYVIFLSFSRYIPVD